MLGLAEARQTTQLRVPFIASDVILRTTRCTTTRKQTMTENARVFFTGATPPTLREALHPCKAKLAAPLSNARSAAPDYSISPVCGNQTTKTMLKVVLLGRVSDPFACVKGRRPRLIYFRHPPGEALREGMVPDRPWILRCYSPPCLPRQSRGLRQHRTGSFQESREGG